MLQQTIAVVRMREKYSLERLVAAIVAVDAGSSLPTTSN